MKKNSLKPLTVCFALGGVWDCMAGILYSFVIGTGRLIDNPDTDPFYALFLGSFFFCFAYLQFVASFNIRKYLIVVGCLISGRILYILLLYGFMLFVEGFPPVFWFTGIVDGLLTFFTLLTATRGGLRIKELFVPVQESLQYPSNAADPG